MAYEMDKKLTDIVKILSDLKTAYNVSSRTFLNELYCDGIVEGFDQAIKEIEYYDATHCSNNKTENPMLQYRIIDKGFYDGLENAIGKTVWGKVDENDKVKILGKELLKIGCTEEFFTKDYEYGFSDTMIQKI